MDFDLIIKNANLSDGQVGIDIACKDGIIASIGAGIDANAENVIDAKGLLVSPPFVDPHFHMDATLSLGTPRMNVSGTLLEGIALWSELKPVQTVEQIIERALRYCDLAVSMGIGAIRSHVDICDNTLKGVEALLEVQKKVAPYLDLQLVAFPQDGIFRDPDAITTGKNNIQDTNRDDRKKIVSGDASKKGGGAEMSAEELRKKNVERYRDIMDIKGMNKDAAYNSLIAASQAINESGDFKGDIKSGKLINQIIQATSKQFDKPKATKDAIDTLILKGEIEKDIKASDPSSKIANEFNLARIDKLKKELNPSFNTLKAGFAKDNKGQSGIDLAAGTYAANNGIDFKGNIISKSEFNDILKDLKTKTKGLDEDLIIKNYTEEIIKTQEAPDGAYTVGDKIVIIQDKQVIAVE